MKAMAIDGNALEYEGIKRENGNVFTVWEDAAGNEVSFMA